MEQEKATGVFCKAPKDPRVFERMAAIAAEDGEGGLVRYLADTEEYLKAALVDCHEDAFQRLQGAAKAVRELRVLISNARGYLDKRSR